MTQRLIDDPRWRLFVHRYAFSLRRFATEVVGMVPTHQQLDLLDSVAPPGSRTSVRSGHGSGKSRSIAVIALWHLICYPKSNTLLTAPKIEQVRNISWKEISDVLELMRSKGGHPWIVDYVVIEAERVYIRGYKQTWFVFAKTAPRGNPENLAGMHRDWYLVIADEASGIPDPNYSILTGALTDARNRMVMLSQPTRPSGFFYETHNALAAHNGGAWNAIRMDSTDSPLVSAEFIEEKKAEYTDEEYVIKVLGEFPEQRDDYLLGRKASEACIGRRIFDDEAPYGILLTCDVGAGEYRDKSVAVIAKVYGDGDFGPDARRVEVVSVPLISNTRNLQNFTGAIFQAASELESVTVLVDAGGMGVAVCQGLESMGLSDVVRVKWGVPCFKRRNKDRFTNLRAQAMVSAARAAKEGRLGIADGPWRRELLDQMSRVPFSFDERARYVIAKKADMQRQGLPSPDLWDAISFCFLEGVAFNVCEAGAAGIASAGERAVQETESLFADVA